MSQHLDTRDPAPFPAPQGEPEFIPLYPSKQRRGRRSGPRSGSRTTLIVLLCLVVVAGAGLLAHASMTPLAGSGTMLAPAAKAKAKTAPAPKKRTTPPAKAVLATLNVRQNDLPGWTPDSSSDGNTPDDPKVDAQIAKCAPAVAAVVNSDHNPTEVDSPDFTLGQQDISSSAASVDSAQHLASDRAVITSAQYRSCLRSVMGPVFADELPAGASVSGLAVTALPRYAGEPKSVVVNLRATAVVRVSGQSLTVYSDEAMIAGNLIESAVNVNSVGAPMAAALEQRIITTVGNRVAAA